MRKQSKGNYVKIYTTLPSLLENGKVYWVWGLLKCHLVDSKTDICEVIVAGLGKRKVHYSTLMNKTY